MHEIKFRQRNRITGVWFYWGFINGIWTNPMQEKDAIRPFDQFDNPEGSDQFTGRSDQNGKDIYKGDVLYFCYPKYPDSEGNYAVRWNEEDLCFEAVRDEPYNYMDPSIWNKGKIVGSITENPELMEK